MLVDLRTSTSKTTSRSAGGTAPTRAAAGETAARSESLLEQVSGRLRRLDPAAPDFRRRSKVAFLESVLTREFGDGIALDPEFGALVQRVADLIECDKDASEQLERVLVESIGGRVPGI